MKFKCGRQRMNIEFTQFFMPNGRQKPAYINRPEEIAEKAKQLQANDCRLEIEMLPTREISMTVEKDLPDGEIELLSQKVCSNGPEVPTNVDQLIIEAFEKVDSQ